MTREEEEAQYAPGELEDVHRILQEFIAGKYGAFGTTWEPGLAPRLEAVERFWAYRRKIGSEVVEASSLQVTLKMSPLQLSSAITHFRQQLDNLAVNKPEGKLSDPGVEEHILKYLFFEDLHKTFTKAYKRVTKAK